MGEQNYVNTTSRGSSIPKAAIFRQEAWKKPAVRRGEFGIGEALALIGSVNMA